MSMGNILFSSVAFIVALGLLITIHEFGHFWVARRAGVKVLRFSVGFGKALWKKTTGPDNTEYMLAAIPLGGYVKMLDEREGEVAEHELHRAFNRQSLAKRSAIVFAGPLFNFLFAIVAYWLMFVIGLQGIKPVIGTVTENSPAAMAGLQAADEIVAVADHATPTWDAVRQAILTGVFDSGQVRLTVRRPGVTERDINLRLDENFINDVKDGRVLEKLGLQMVLPTLPAIIGEVIPGKVAQKAGLLAGDKVQSANGEAISEWDQWVRVIRAHPGKAVPVTVERQGQTIEFVLTPDTVDFNGETIGQIGAAPLPPGPVPEHLQAVVRYGPVEALITATTKTWDMSVLTLRMLGKMIIGKVSLENLSGPITIAKYAGYTASAGLPTFLAFLAIVSVSLGVLNLLPIPVLDGGHLMFYGIEWIKGGPLSESYQVRMQQVGLAVLLLLMSIALYNDFARILE